MRHRSLLFTPGTEAARLRKSLTTGADGVIWDLEDAVLPERKADARGTVQSALDGAGLGRPIFIRVNAAGSPWFDEDMQLAMHPALQGVVLPKAEPPLPLEHLTAARQAGKSVILIIESARGLRDLRSLLEAGVATGVALGAYDLAVDLGLTPTESGLELLYAQSRLVTYARAAGISELYNAVTVQVRDAARLEADAARGHALGFTGQLVIHPSQVDVVNRAYGPSASEQEWAARVLLAVEAATRLGRGAILVDGQLVDRPILERARQIQQLSGTGESGN